MRPMRAADLLQPGEAQNSVNAKLTSGALTPYLSPSTILALTSGSPIKTIYRFGQSSASETAYWWQFNGDVDVVKGPNATDTEERTYWTDGVYPKKSNAALSTVSTPYPTSSYQMGIPPFSAAITATVTGTATVPTDPIEYVTYVVTYVSAWAEEGPVNTASTTVGWRAGQTITLTGLPTAGPGAGYNIISKRIYRSASGSSSTKFQLVTLTDMAIATASYVDTALTANLGEVLATDDWMPPPATMIGLTSMPNGVMAGFTGNTLCFSEPWAPYAWPVKYQQSTDAPIVGICAFDQSLLVGTTRSLYVFTGIDPATISSEKLAAAQSVVSKTSMVAMAGGVVFASPDGLFMMSSGGLVNLTETLMTRVEWQAYKPDSIRAFESDNRYIAFFDTGARQGGMIFTLGANPTFSETDVYPTAGFRDKGRDALYVVVANTVKKWDAGTALTQTWTSGVFRAPHPVNLAAARVDAVTYPVTFQLYADGTLKHTQTVADKYAFRLPSGYRSTQYHFTVSSTNTVRMVEMGTSPLELSLG
jgi:hypothetical protein